MAVSEKQDPARRAARNALSSESQSKIHQGPARLRQIQYRSYQVDIQIYHFRADYISVHNFRKLLSRQRDGYIDTLIGTDTLASEQFVPNGDELPVGCIEVAYLPGVFPKQNTHSTSGSALGFRVGNNTIQWFCFDRPIQDSLLNTWAWDTNVHDVRVMQTSAQKSECKLFDIVARIDKGLKQRRVKGANKEHKQWHDSLWHARLRPVRVRLTWKSYATEARESRERTRAEAQRRMMVQEDERDIHAEMEEIESDQYRGAEEQEAGMENEDKDTEDEMGYGSD
jgi:hypothetical protein